MFAEWIFIFVFWFHLNKSESKPKQMFCLVSWPDTSLVLKCCIAWQQEQNVLVHQFAMIAAIESAGPSCSLSAPSLLLRNVASPSKRFFFFFSFLFLFFRHGNLPEKRNPDSAGEPWLASEISACYRLQSEEPSEQTEASVAAVRIPFHTPSNRTDLELRAAAVNAEEAETGIDTADPETLDNQPRGAVNKLEPRLCHLPSLRKLHLNKCEKRGF